MVILKKIKASTLMETLVATVLIVAIFMIASMILNNLFSKTIENNTRSIDAHLNELHYLYLNEKLKIPFYEDFESWDISIENNTETIVFEALNTKTNKTILKTYIAN